MYILNIKFYTDGDFAFASKYTTLTNEYNYKFSAVFTEKTYALTQVRTLLNDLKNTIRGLAYITERVCEKIDECLRSLDETGECYATLSGNYAGSCIAFQETNDADRIQETYANMSFNKKEIEVIKYALEHLNDCDLEEYEDRETLDALLTKLV